MIYSKLPFDINDLAKIKTDGATVKLAKNDFSKYTDNDCILTSLIYLRNLSFDNIKLDFSDLQYVDKEKYLLLYVSEDMYIKNCNIVDIWFEIFYKYCFNSYFDKSILDNAFTDEEVQKFIDAHNVVIDDMLSLLKSTILFLITKANLDGYVDNVQHVQTIPISSNLLNFIEHKQFMQFFLRIFKKPQIEFKYFDNVFVDNNQDLLSCLNKTLLGFGLFYAYSIVNKQL